MRNVVITGMGAISPIGNDIPSVRASLMAGRHGIAPIDRFDAADFSVKLAAQVKDFDPKAYMPGPEARRMDLYAQYAMAAAIQAVEMSGVMGHVPDHRLGVYVGSGIGGMQTFIAETIKLEKEGPRRVSPFFVPMMIGNMASGLISIRFSAKGPVLPVVTACATGTHAIGEACRAIAHGYADAVIAGGAEACVNKLAIAGFANLKALSTQTDPDRASIPFDRRRDGFVLGEGAGILVLESEESAGARGARILARVVGYGNTSDAYHMTAPDPTGQGAATALSLALETAGEADPSRIHINAHGTSTPLNDAGETLAFTKVFGQDVGKVAVTSTKSMTGHMLGAAGAIEAIACVLALSEGRVPPTAGYLEADPECGLNIVSGAARPMDIGLAVSMSLGFGGHNAAIALAKA